MRCSKLGWNKLKNGTIVEETSKNVYEWSFPIGSYPASKIDLYGETLKVYYKYTFNNLDKPILQLQCINAKYENSVGFRSIYTNSSHKTINSTLELQNLACGNISNIQVAKYSSINFGYGKKRIVPINIITGLNFETANVNYFIKKYSKNRFTRKVTEYQYQSAMDNVIPRSIFGPEPLEVYGPYEMYESFVEGLKFCLSQPIKT